MAKANECLTRKIAPKVLVLKRRWAISLKNSRLCFLGCNGNFSASLSPNISMVAAFNSTFWPLPKDAITSPVTLMQAPVVKRFKIVSSNSPSEATTCRLLLVLPSFSAINWLLRKVRTHPITVASKFTLSPANSVLIFILLLNILFKLAANITRFLVDLKDCIE